MHEQKNEFNATKKNNVLKDDKNANTGHFWIYLLATTNNEYRRRDIS